MPIVDLQCVAADDPPAPGLAQALADALGVVFATPPGRTWVRLSSLHAQAYAENGVQGSADDAPVFVTLTLADPPPPEDRATQALQVAQAVGAVLARDPGRVHVEYAAPARGRIAFGGVLVL